MLRGSERDKRSERSHVWEVCPHAFVGRQETCLNPKKKKEVISIVFSIRKEHGGECKGPQVWTPLLITSERFVTSQFTWIKSPWTFCPSQDDWRNHLQEEVQQKSLRYKSLTTFGRQRSVLIWLFVILEQPFCCVSVSNTTVETIGGTNQWGGFCWQNSADILSHAVQVEAELPTTLIKSLYLYFWNCAVINLKEHSKSQWNALNWCYVLQCFFESTRGSWSPKVIHQQVNHFMHTHINSFFGLHISLFFILHRNDRNIISCFFV